MHFILKVSFFNSLQVKSDAFTSRNGEWFRIHYCTSITSTGNAQKPDLANTWRVALSLDSSLVINQAHNHPHTTQNSNLLVYNGT